MKEVTLNGILPGEGGTVVRMEAANPKVRQRLLEMGLIRGTPIELIRVAPMGDPIEVKVKGNIEVNGILFFRTSANFEGDVKYKKLIVEEGANISGSLVNVSSVVKPIQPVIENGQSTNTLQQQIG